MSRWATGSRRRQFLKGSLCAPVVRVHYWCIARTTAAMGRPHRAHQDADALIVRTRYRGAHCDYRRDGCPPWICRDDRRLVIQQATATLSPRFMRLWYRDPLQKVVLATFAGTFTYSFALLRRIDTNFVPDLGVTIAGIAVAVSLILLLVYLNRFTHTLGPWPSPPWLNKQASECSISGSRSWPDRR